MGTPLYEYEVPSPTSTAASPVARARTSQALSDETIPDNIHKLEYAVRGRVFLRSTEILANLEKYPFDRLVQCNIGNPHAVGVPALTYIRELLSMLSYPNLEDCPEEKLLQLFKKDSIAKAKKYRSYVGDVGSYTHSQGALGFREIVADFLFKRDGVAPSVKNIFMCNGASDGINTLLECIIDGPNDGVLLPIPQYPLYAATITRLKGTIVDYLLNEEKAWSLDFDQIRAGVRRAREEGVDVKVLVLITPGNPASCVLEEDEIKTILKYCADEKILVIADEVYQENIYRGKPFVSVRRVLLANGLKTQLASFHSCSKGLAGECGARGGFMQFENVDTPELDIIYKLRSVSLCSSTHGQAVMAAVLDPPKPGDESYDLYAEESRKLLSEYALKAQLAEATLNSLPNMSCQPIRAGMYAFPRIYPTQAMLDAAKGANMSFDVFYSLELLEATGIVVTPGDGFGQAANTHHIRLTILPALELFKDALSRFSDFHTSFVDKYKD